MLSFVLYSVIPLPAGDNLAATFQDGRQDATVTPRLLSGSVAQRIWLDPSVYIQVLLSISLNFVVDH